MAKKIFNANNKIKVKLNDDGIIHYYQKINHGVRPKDRVSLKSIFERQDEQGYFTFPLAELMFHLGWSCTFGAETFDMNLVIDDDDLDLIEDKNNLPIDPPK